MALCAFQLMEAYRCLDVLESNCVCGKEYTTDKNEPALYINRPLLKIESTRTTYPAPLFESLWKKDNPVGGPLGGFFSNLPETWFTES